MSFVDANRPAYAGRFFLLLTLLFPPTFAAAQSPRERSVRSDEEARALYDAGEVAFSEGRYDEALERFEAAYARSGRAPLLYNIALAHDRLRHDEEALAAFEHFLAEGSPAPELRVQVEARVAAIRRSIEERHDLERRAATVPTAEETALASPPSPAQRDEGTTPLRKRWWFWTSIGAGVALAIILPVALTRDSGPDYVAGSTGGVIFTLGSR